MMHLAMHDALNAVERRYEAFAFDGPEAEVGSAAAGPIAAAAHAAFAVAIAQYPDRRTELEDELARWVGAAGGGALASSRTIGESAARAVLATRAGDGWDREAEYTWHPMGPGVYAEFHEHSDTPVGFVFGAGWAKARPFLLERADQFRSPPPPAIDSPAYTRAFDEVASVGRHESTTRTADQTHLAMWWKDFVESSHNRLARQLARQDELDPWRAARMFALLNASIFDAYVGVFDNKFHYNHWRPYTAIRWAANDGNPDTEPDPAWDNLHHHTYAFPSYPSAHGCASAAAMTALADTFGAERRFRMFTPTVDAAGPMSGKIAMQPPYRSFASFDAAAREAAASRVYLGIHFRYDSEQGHDLGCEIGGYAVEHYLRAR
ncbi:MAG: vanadium-dependent haloperoxidase [Planctomycetes bacterium]|nr:vanadium-dependent haloperoxidase [Planctomycetota bacterium]